MLEWVLFVLSPHKESWLSTFHDLCGSSAWWSSTTTSFPCCLKPGLFISPTEKNSIITSFKCRVTDGLCKTGNSPQHHASAIVRQQQGALCSWCSGQWSTRLLWWCISMWFCCIRVPASSAVASGTTENLSLLFWLVHQYKSTPALTFTQVNLTLQRQNGRILLKNWSEADNLRKVKFCFGNQRFQNQTSAFGSHFCLDPVPKAAVPWQNCSGSLSGIAGWDLLW